MRLSLISMGRLRPRRACLPAIIAFWIVAVMFGVRYMMAYEGTAGTQADAPGRWPASLRLPRDPALPTVVVALHPRCACSKASLTELEKAAEDFHRPYNAILLIYQPRGADYNWQQVSFYREAQQALHAHVIADEDGRMALAFGAETSGQVLLYSAADSRSTGSLLFSGGVTSARGETGDNSNLQSLLHAFRKQAQAQPAGTPVFGCGLLEHNSSLLKEDRQ